MIGDVLSGFGEKCVTVPRIIFVNQFVTPPPVLVTPPPFTFVPVVTATPPPVLVTPPPLILQNGKVVQVPPFFANVPPVTVTLQPVVVNPPPFLAQPPNVQLPGQQAILVFEQRCFETVSAAARASSFKIAEDESPFPVDRVYLGFNYFDQVNQAVNLQLGGNVNNTQVYRETIGFEKTFLDRSASVEMRLPLATLNIDSDVPGIGGSNTDIGDLSIGFKYAPYLDRSKGNVISTGLEITVPTGPREFNPFNTTILQPWLGYGWTHGYWFIHGFSSIAIPTDSRDVTLWFNDMGIGYDLYTDETPEARISAVIPTLEVHVNTPLNHRGASNAEEDPLATPDWVTLTLGTTVNFRQRTSLALAVGVPITGPRPYDYEIIAQLNYRF
jgi:hypothetical protein